MIKLRNGGKKIGDEYTPIAGRTQKGGKE